MLPIAKRFCFGVHLKIRKINEIHNQKLFILQELSPPWCKSVTMTCAFETTEILIFTSQLLGRAADVLRIMLPC